MASNFWGGKQKKCKASGTKEDPKVLNGEDDEDEKEEPEEQGEGTVKKQKFQQQ